MSETPKDIQGQVTEEIMLHFWGVEFKGTTYNKAYSHVYKTLKKYNLKQ